YRRMSLLIFYIFYKQLAVTLLQFWFAFHSGFSGGTVYDDYMSNGYNLIFAAYPIIILSILDQDLPDHLLLKYPQLYKPLLSDCWYNQKLFWSWILFAIYNSLVNFYLGMFL